MKTGTRKAIPKHSTVTSDKLRVVALGKDERRSFPMDELRVSDDGKKIVGHAAVFNSLSVPMFGFREQIKPGAFKKTIEKEDVRALQNHDPNFVLGRNKAGTLKLKEDSRGLHTEIDPPDTQFARDLMTSIKRGDVSQMSFGFRTVTDKWYTKDSETRRDLIEVKLFDVSPVTFPAYTATDVGVRSIASCLGVDADSLEQVLAKAANYHELSDKDCEVLRVYRDFLQGCLPDNEGQDSRPTPQSLGILSNKLDLLEVE